MGENWAGTWGNKVAAEASGMFEKLPREVPDTVNERFWNGLRMFQEWSKNASGMFSQWFRAGVGAVRDGLQIV